MIVTKAYTLLLKVKGVKTMDEKRCCGNCEHYSPYSNVIRNNGICKEYEAIVHYSHNICGFYCKNGGRENNG